MARSARSRASKGAMRSLEEPPVPVRAEPLGGSGVLNQQRQDCFGSTRPSLSRASASGLSITVSRLISFKSATRLLLGYNVVMGLKREVLFTMCSASTR